ncbi:predicted protein [Phaeodactylum tricornutum CCAP 1055/1]|jgi:uncharacterized membrane protein|uniref:DUF2061 domain-containing protein n=1 Tax=Phaeodactylum tricornutum (strain CCAP 1055/1) TaxID=556484 RepID=B7GE05_PHATC|nr:predicted protein [Phaeodactylum tricornutum CCAP 1055/1]EEC43167.1 predicted protein [Phaeodactylum tricornutum CCAP 1055/1]|eukprot:XP_002185298.1 predicted protein [Phaeodactylum tricornutum CCAP 1055/1]
MDPHEMDGSSAPRRRNDNHWHQPLNPQHEVDTDQPALETDITLREESHMRSIVKGLTWRIVATTTTTIIAWLVTGKVEAALQIGFFEFFAKLLIYYLHERLWIRIAL